MPKLDLIGLVVEDMAESLTFYRLMGLEIPAEADSEDHVEVKLEAGLRLAWDTRAMVQSFMDEWTEPSGHRIGMAFLCESPKEVDAVYARLLEAGHSGRKEPWDAFWGQRYAIIEDPDGNSVDLFAWA